MTKHIRLGILIIAMLWGCAHSVSAASARSVVGVVLDDKGCPIPGASVVVERDGVALAGRATGADGQFAISVVIDSGRPILHVSAVGYTDRRIPLTIGQDTSHSEIWLAANPPDMGVIQVTSAPRVSSATVTTAAALREQARRNLIPSDPISSLEGPSIARLGSSHSAQVRVDGTNPPYYLNGMSIGTDPSHYGAFAVIPMSVISEMRFYAQGTPAGFGAPSAVEFATADNFTRHSDGEAQLSTIDLTTRFSAGTPSLSILGSVRKSVLDELATKIRANASRRTIPPTAFIDMYLSTGWRLSSVYSLAVDQYYARDKLSFNTSGATGNADGIDTYQRTDGSHIGLRLQALYPGVLLKGSVGVKTSRKEYVAEPPAGDHEDFRLNLREGIRAADYAVSAAFSRWGFSYEIGAQGEVQSHRDVTLSQENWNFLPPFANSNDGYTYQDALNRAWGTYAGSSPASDHAAYVTAERRFGRFTFTGGVRGEYFGSLAEKPELLHRQSLTFQAGNKSGITIYHGTFAESPSDNILEPYQVIINDQRDRLLPIRTDLWSLSVSKHGLQVVVFHKRISNRPVVTPNFSQVDYAKGVVGPQFLVMQSNGLATFDGGTISLDLKKFPARSLDTRLWYGYTQAERVESGVTMAYESNAPHRFGSSIDWHVTRRWGLGGELQIRSGYPYTPLHESQPYSFADYYSPSYYTAALEQENSRRFPANAFVNIHAGYSFGGSAVFFSISNVTNRANPIINSSTGYIYDAGILPMVGLDLHF